jgi:hypothetical protein
MRAHFLICRPCIARPTGTLAAQRLEPGHVPQPDGLSGTRMPRMNSIMERWVQTCRYELLDRNLVWNQRYLP